MMFHENCLPADDSHGISYIFFFRKLRKMLQNLSSSEVVIGALRVKAEITFESVTYSKFSFTFKD